MRQQKGKFILIAVILVFSLTSSACGSPGGSGVEPAGDIAIEAQTVPTATAANTPTPQTPATPASTSTSLPTEIIEPISPVSPITAANQSVMSPNPTVPIIPGSEKTLAAAIADLVKQTGIAPDQIILISLEAVEWSDTSLGCPQEGFMYAQVITPGYMIVLAAQGQQYEYHTDQTTNVILCQN
jgi:hypothetical protein